MTTPKNEIEFSYPAAFAAVISMFFVYLLYQFLDILAGLENFISDVPYLARIAITYLFPDESEEFVTAHSKLKILTYVFLFTFLIKFFISVMQAFTSIKRNNLSYFFILFIVEGVFLYFNLNIEIIEIIAILIGPNIIILSLLDD